MVGLVSASHLLERLVSEMNYNVPVDGNVKPYSLTHSHYSVVYLYHHVAAHICIIQICEFCVIVSTVCDSVIDNINRTSCAFYSYKKGSGFI